MNRWYSWVLAPVMIASAIIIPLAAVPPSITGYVVTYAVSLTLVLAALGLANPRKFNWALRAVAGMVVAAGVGYFGSELIAWQNGKSMGVLGRRSSTSLWNAGLFLIVFGLPAIRFLISGYSGSVVDVLATPQQTPDVAPADVERVVARDFLPVERARVMVALHQYGAEKSDRENARVRLAALKLADGHLDQLRLEISAANTDYRDVIAAAEYPLFMQRRLAGDELSPDERERIFEADWTAYHEWLKR